MKSSFKNYSLYLLWLFLTDLRLRNLQKKSEIFSWHFMYCTCKTNYLQKHRNVFLYSTPVNILINYSLLHSYVGFSFLRKFFLPKIEHLTFWHVGFLPAHLFILLSADSCCVGMAFSSWPSIFLIVLVVKSTECQACWFIEGGKRINVKLYLKWSSSYSSLGWILFETDAVKGAIKCLLS